MKNMSTVKDATFWLSWSIVLRSDMKPIQLMMKHNADRLEQSWHLENYSKLDERHLVGEHVAFISVIGMLSSVMD